MFKSLRSSGCRSDSPLPRQLWLKAFGLSLTVCAASGVQAQSLTEMWTMASEQDATYQSAKALAKSAEYRQGQARSLLWPQVSATAGIQKDDLKLEPAGSPITFKGDAQTQSAAIQARMALINLANWSTIAQSQRALSISGLDLQLAEQDLMVRLAQAYFDVLLATETLQTARANKAATTEQLASAKRAFEVGTSTITDSREAQARFDLITAQELVAENDLLQKQATLAQLVGQTQVRPHSLAQPVVLPPLPEGDLQAWIAKAQSDNPAIRKAQAALEIARLETRKAQAGHLPTLDAVGSVGTRKTSDSSLSTSPNGTTQNASVGLQLTIPLFAGFAVQSRVKETLALEEKAQSDLQGAQRQVSLGTRQIYEGLKSGHAQVKALEAAQASHQSLLEATQLGYKVGVRVNLDVLNAQTQLYATQRDLARARYEVLLASLKLQQVTGQLSPEHLAALGSLLKP